MSKSNKNDRKRGKRNEKHRQTKQRQESIRREQATKRDEPNLRLVSDSPGGLDSPPSPPSPMSMERTMREFHQMLESQEFVNEDEVDASVDELNAWAGAPSPMADEARTASEKAQELAYDAMETDDPNTAVKLAMRAVELDRSCVDALVILAHPGSDSPGDLIENIEKIVWIGEIALGADYFEKNHSHF